MKIRIIAAILLCVAAASECLKAAAVTSAVPTDSLQSVQDDYRFKPRQLIVPGALLAVGSWGVSNGWLKRINHEVRHALKGTSKYGMDDYFQFLPMAGNVGLGALGVKSRHDFRERALTTATSWVLLEVTVQGLKHMVRSDRPDGTDRHSFPSGHVARSFMGAELVRIEYGDLWGLGAYAVATGVGLMRIHNDRHWLSDTLAGAGLGILCARAGNWLLPWERKLLGWDKIRSAVAAIPYYDATSGSVGASLIVALP